MIKFYTLVVVSWLSLGMLSGQNYWLEGNIQDVGLGEPLDSVTVAAVGIALTDVSDSLGNFRLGPFVRGKYQVRFSGEGLQSQTRNLTIKDRDLTWKVRLVAVTYDLASVEIAEAESSFGVRQLKEVEGTAIYAGRKTEVVDFSQLTADLGANQSREAFATITGLNIWESDGGGLQLGIGGRGLNPNRTQNFNTRQNGYDMSADALGYPETYYTPPMLALERVEVVRGAASLQYGTQFGGLVNFVKKSGPERKAQEFNVNQRYGSFNRYHLFTSAAFQKNKVKSYSYYQYRRGNGAQPNSKYTAHGAYSGLTWNPTAALEIKGEYTFMQYLAQQPGGLTDTDFRIDPYQSFRERNFFGIYWNLAALQLNWKIGPATELDSRFFGLYGGRNALGYRGPVSSADPITITRAPSWAKERNLIKGEFRNIGNETRLIHRYGWKGIPQTFLMGLRVYRGNNQSQQGNGSEGFDADFRFLRPDDLENSSYRFPSSNVAVFAEHIFRIKPKWSITPGLRGEYIRTQADGTFRETVRDLADNIVFDSTFVDLRDSKRAFLLGGIGLSYKEAGKWEFYANISQNYRSISFNDFREVNPSFVVDPEMKDERGFNADLGWRVKKKDWFQGEFTLFYLSYQDRIGAIQQVNPETFQVFRYRTNIADARTIGLETYVEADLWRAFLKRSSPTQLSVFSNLALLDARYLASDEAAVEGKQVEMVPRVLLRSGLRFRHHQFSGTLLYSYLSQQFSDATNAVQVASAVAGVIPAYDILDISLSYTYRWFVLGAGVHNLANERYFTRRAEGYPGPGIISADPRNFYVSLAFRL
ncbi:MAG: TonB-dependent receptor [Bacteroidota bacterium]